MLCTYMHIHLLLEYVISACTKQESSRALEFHPIGVGGGGREAVIPPINWMCSISSMHLRIPINQESDPPM